MKSLLSSFVPRRPSLLSLVSSAHGSSLARRAALPPFESAVLTKDESARADGLVDFLNASPDPFHTVQSVAQRLRSAGFTELKEDAHWGRDREREHAILPGGAYFYQRQGSSVVAFAVGERFQPGHGGFKILGAHTDSPCLKLKPKSRRGSTHGVVQLSVECYGGGLWHTWMDRDLSLSGRVILRRAGGEDFETRLVRIDRPVLRVPNLCIHLRSAEERESMRINKEEHLQPLLCDVVSSALAAPSPASNDSWSAAQEPLLLSLLASTLECKEEEIADFELSLFDTQPAARTGMFSEFLCGARLDNLASCFAITEALVEHTQSGALQEDDGVAVLAFFDHEEVGSESVVGAGSTLIADTVDRLCAVLHKESNSVDNELVRNTKARSFIMSVDMAHAVHPNYASKHDKNHAPTMNGGLVIKSNANQRYATSGVSGFLTREMGRRANVTVQEFAVRNDCPCGSTIGPTLSTNTGIRAVDIGMPQLSMHSIREMMGCKDLTHANKLFTTFYKDFSNVDKSLR